MNKKVVIGTLTTLGILAASMTSVYADTATPAATPATGTTASARTQEFKQFKDAITNNDFATFENLYKTKTGTDITQDSFNKLVQLESLHKQEVQIRTDLKTAGVKMFGGGHSGMGKMRGRGAHFGRTPKAETQAPEAQDAK
ncbi:MAG: hypothetical protein NTZ25_00800 [Candidatus Peregrinibacteria bacterium]|nr:hypothetical protein [Candidatus Peregrinibacteria bacterium]